MEQEPCEQHQKARSLAAKALLAREQLVSAVASGELRGSDLWSVVEADPLSARVFALKALEGAPGMRKVKTRRLFAELGIEQDATLAALTPDQRSKMDQEMDRSRIL